MNIYGIGPAGAARILAEIIEAFDDVRVVGEAASGTLALELDRRLRPDVAVVDVLLPQAADGLGVLAGLASRERPIVAISVCDGLGSDAIAAGATASSLKGHRQLRDACPRYVPSSPAHLDRQSVQVRMGSMRPASRRRLSIATETVVGVTVIPERPPRPRGGRAEGVHSDVQRRR